MSDLVLRARYAAACEPEPTLGTPSEEGVITHIHVGDPIKESSTIAAGPSHHRARDEPSAFSGMPCDDRCSLLDVISEKRVWCPIEELEGPTSSRSNRRLAQPAYRLRGRVPNRHWDDKRPGPLRPQLATQQLYETQIDVGGTGGGLIGKKPAGKLCKVGILTEPRVGRIPNDHIEALCEPRHRPRSFMEQATCVTETVKND